MPLPTFIQSELEPYVDQAKLSSHYDKYISQGLSHKSALAYANAEMGGLTAAGDTMAPNAIFTNGTSIMVAGHYITR